MVHVLKFEKHCFTHRGIVHWIELQRRGRTSLVFFCSHRPIPAYIPYTPWNPHYPPWHLNMMCIHFPRITRTCLEKDTLICSYLIPAENNEVELWINYLITIYFSEILVASIFSKLQFLNQKKSLFINISFLLLPGQVHTYKIHAQADWHQQLHEGHSCGLVGRGSGKPDNCFKGLLFSFLIIQHHQMPRMVKLLGCTELIKPWFLPSEGAYDLGGKIRHADR